VGNIKRKSREAPWLARMVIPNPDSRVKRG
jgi:hypothetical protein